MAGANGRVHNVAKVLERFAGGDLYVGPPVLRMQREQNRAFLDYLAAGQPGGVKTLEGGADVPREVAVRTRYVGPDGRPVSLSRPSDPYAIRSRDRRRMMVNPVVKLALAARMAPVQSAFQQFSVECADPIVREFVRETMTPLLRQVVATSLQAIAYGFAPHEKVFEVRDVQLDLGADQPDGRRLVTIPGAVVYRRIKDLDPDQTDIMVQGPLQEFAGLRYQHDDRQRISAEASYVVTHNGQFGQMYGTSDLDAAYGPWYTLEVITLFCNRWYERKGDPPARAYVPPVSGYEKNLGDASSVDIMTVAYERLRTSGCMILPSIYDANGNRLYEFDLLDGQDRSEVFIRYLEFLTRQILWAILVPDGAIYQAGRVGSYAAARTYADLLVTLREIDLEEIEEHINRFLVQPLVARNFPAAPPCTIRATLRPEVRVDTLLQVFRSAMAAEEAAGYQRLLQEIDPTELLRQLHTPIRPTSPAQEG